jgi:hypothetical protein
MPQGALMSLAATGAQEQQMGLTQTKVASSYDELEPTSSGGFSWKWMIPRSGDLFQPLALHIECQPDAPTESVLRNLTDFQVMIGGSVIQRIPFSLLTALGTTDREGDMLTVAFDMKMFMPEFYMVCLQYHEVCIEVRRIGGTSIQAIRLLGEYRYLQNQPRHALAAGHHALPIQQIETSRAEGLPQTTSTYKFRVNFNLLSKGYFLEGNLDQLTRYKLMLNNNVAADYSRATLRYLGKRLSPTLWWLPFEAGADFRNPAFASFMGGLNHSRVDNVRMELRFSAPQTALTLHNLHSNILRIQSGMGGLVFATGGGGPLSLSTGADSVPASLSSSNSPVQAQNWSSAPRPVDADRTMCPIEYEDIGAGAHYGHCVTCRHNFLETPLKECLKRKPDCPMCRKPWADWTIYTNTQATSTP